MKPFAAFAFALSFAAAASAYEGSGLNLRIEGTLPSGAFANLPSYVGEPELGYGYGVGVTCMLTPSLGWTGETGLYFNPLADSNVTYTMAQFGSHFNIPFLMGPVLMGNAWQNVRGYLVLLGGIDLGSRTDADYRGRTVTTDWSSAFGYGLGAGLLIAKRYDVGFRIYSLGERELVIHDPDALVSDPKAQPLRANVTPTLLALHVGLHFDTGR